MNLPRRCGNMYIKFSKDTNQPEYGFEVQDNKIKRFILLSDKNFDTIVLPKLVEDVKLDMPSINEKNSCGTVGFITKRELRNYITGSVKICDGCFRGLKEAKIIVPFENSIMLDYGSFDNDADIDLVLPSNLTLKQIYRMFDTGFDYEHENWTVVGDKSIAGKFGLGGYGYDDYSIMEYNEEDLDYKVANFKVSHLTLSDQDTQAEEDVME